MPKKLPDFIIGGAPRSGTTWLYRVLDPHPQIYLAKPLQPEPKFFLVDDLYRRGIQYYQETWFAEAPPEKLAGEKSTNYLESATTAMRIQEHLPWVKLIFILREPVERAFSNYLWSKTNKMENEDFETALALEQERERSLPPRLRFARPHAYFSRGLYADLLAPFFARFPRTNILCLPLDLLAEAPEAFLERVHRFLEVELRPQDCAGVGLINATEGEHSQTIRPETRERLKQAYADANRRLVDLLGEDFRRWLDL